MDGLEGLQTGDWMIRHDKTTLPRTVSNCEPGFPATATQCFFFFLGNLKLLSKLLLLVDRDEGPRGVNARGVGANPQRVTPKRARSTIFKNMKHN